MLTADGRRSLRRRYECVFDVLQIIFGHFLGRRVALRKGHIHRPVHYTPNGEPIDQYPQSHRRKRGCRTEKDLPLSGHPFSSANAVDVSARRVRSALFSAQGASVDALRPACASWIPTFAACVCAKLATRLSGAICVSVQSPASSGEMRPSGTTAVASMTMPPAPRVAKPCSASSTASVRPSVRLWRSSSVGWWVYARRCGLGASPWRDHCPSCTGTSATRLGN
jgi:hypothetical protein